MCMFPIFCVKLSGLICKLGFSAAIEFVQFWRRLPTMMGWQAFLWEMLEIGREKPVCLLLTHSLCKHLHLSYTSTTVFVQTLTSLTWRLLLIRIFSLGRDHQFLGKNSDWNCLTEIFPFKLSSFVRLRPKISPGKRANIQYSKQNP